VEGLYHIIYIINIPGSLQYLRLPLVFLFMVFAFVHVEKELRSAIFPKGPSSRYSKSIGQSINETGGWF